MTTFVSSTQLPKSEKFLPSPMYWVFLSEFSCKWYVLLFSTLLYIYFFNLGSLEEENDHQGETKKLQRMKVVLMESPCWPLPIGCLTPQIG